jgi:hypothetical protein
METLHRPPTRIELDVDDVEAFFDEVKRRDAEKKKKQPNNADGNNKAGSGGDGGASGTGNNKKSVPVITGCSVVLSAARVAPRSNTPRQSTPGSASSPSSSAAAAAHRQDSDFLDSPSAGWLLIQTPGKFVAV